MVDFYKTSDQALDEIQTKSKRSELGIPPREIRGQLNNIPKESYGLKDIRRQAGNVIQDIRQGRDPEESRNKLRTIREGFTRL